MKKNSAESKNRKIINGLISLAMYNLLSPFDVVSYAAGVIVDQTALEKHQAILKKTNNNIDQIDIARPNERGLSHNKFLKFNVDKNGMILNNSSQMTLTDLAGLIYGNANIDAGKEAKVILSEVTGLSKSEIDGFIEVAGKEAEFILANPNGIFLSNGGFLNTSKVTMTTGRLEDEIMENGGILFKVTDGEVEIAKGGSVNIARVDYFNIISKAAKIGGALHSGRTENRSTKEIKILTGSNTFDYETEEYTPEENATSNYEYGIDASELGALSAGKITLIATDEGVGVNSKGKLVATIDDVSVDAKGNVLLRDAASRRGNVKVNTGGDFTQDGDQSLIIAEKNFEVVAKGDVKFEGTAGYAKGKDNVKISGKKLKIENASTVISMDDNVNKEQKVEINAEKVEINGKDSRLIAGKNLDMNINTKDTNGNIIYSDDNTIYNEGEIIGRDVDIKSGGITNTNNITGRDTLTIASNKIDNSGDILGVNKLDISGDKDLTNTKTGKISSSKEVNIKDFNNVNNSGKILAEEKIKITEVNNILNADTGKIQSSDEALISSNSLENKGTIYSDNLLNINSDQISNEGTMYSKNTNISGKTSGQGTIVNSALGRILADDRVNITSGVLVSNEGSIKAKEILIATKSADNTGTIVAGDDSLTLNIVNNLVNAGTLLSKNNINIDADTLINKKTGAMLTGKYFDDDGNLVVSTTGDRNINLDVTKEIVNKGSVESLNNINVQGDKLLNEETGSLYSYGDTTLTIEDIENKGRIDSLENINIQSTNLKNEETGAINSRLNTNIDSTNLDNKGEIVSAENIFVNTTGTTENSGEILANKNIEINRKKDLGQMTKAEKDSTTNLINTGTINASEKVLIAANEVTNRNGKIYSGTDIEIDTNQIDNVSGELVTNGNLKIDMTNIDNINHGNDMTINGKLYGNSLISIKNFNNIINDQIDLMSDGDIYLESTEKDIINRNKIVSGGTLDLKAENGKVTNKSITGNALLSAEDGVKINADEYDSDETSRIIGGSGVSEININKELENKGKIFSTGGQLNINIAEGQKSFTNSGQIAVGGDLTIKASDITVKEDTLVYSKNNMILNAMLGNIINEAGAEILTSVGDLTLNADKGNIYNKSIKEKAGRIKSGGNMTATAINFYNEATQVGLQQEQALPEVIKTGSSAAIIAYLLQTDGLNYGDEYTGTYSSSYFSQSWSTTIYYYNIFKSRGQLWDLYKWTTSDKITKDISYARVSSFWEDLVDESKFNVYIDIHRNMTLKGPSNTVSTNQAAVEAGKNLNINLGGVTQGSTTTYSGTLENKGIIRANKDIDIKAGTVKNITIEEQKRIIDKISANFRLTRYTGYGREYMTGPSGQNVSKIWKNVNFVSRNKALISAGGENKIQAGTLINTTSLNTTLNDSVRANQGSSVWSETKDTGVKQTINKQTAESSTKTEETPEAPKEERIKGVNTVLNLKDSIIIPSGDNGLFVRNEDIALGGVTEPLFETNIEYIDQDKYFGSNYVFEKLGLDPDEQTRRLGDNYYETRLVNDAYLKTTGGRKIEEGDIDESSLMKYLLDNSVLAKEELGLVVGEDLNQEQMSKLDRDIVWYVKDKIDGVEVLVPKIYITTNSIEKGTYTIDSSKTGSVIKGEYVKVDSSRFENVGGRVQGYSSVNIESDDILNQAGDGGGARAQILGGNINLKATNDIKNIGGEISGKGSVALKTEKGDIINETTKEKEQFFDGYREKTKDVAYIGGKNVLLDSGRDVILKAGTVGATEQVGVKAKGNIRLDALKLDSKTSRANAYETYNEAETINVGSAIAAGKDITMMADKKVDIRGSRVTSKEGDISIAGDEVTVTGLKNIKDTYYHRDKTTSILDTDEETITDYKETLASSKIDAGIGNVKIVSNKDLNIIGSEIKGAGEDNILMSKEGDVNLKTLALKRNYKRDLLQRSVLKDSQTEISQTITGARDTVVGDYDDTGDDGSSNARAGVLSSAGINASAASLHGKGYSTGTNISEYGASGSASVSLFNQTKVKETLNAKVHAKTKVDVGSLTVLSKKDINLESVDMDATNTLKFMSKEGNINSTYVQDELDTYSEQSTISVGASVSYQSPLLDLVETVKKQVDYSKNSEYSDGSAGEVAARAFEIGGKLSKLAGGTLISARAEVGLSYSHSEKSSEKRTAQDSTINAKNIIMTAEKGKVDLSGMQMIATEDLGIKANEFSLKASESSYNEEESGYQVGVTLAGTGTVSAKDLPDVGGEVGVSSSTLNSYIKSKTYNNALMKGKNVKLDITNNANLIGANVEGENVNANIGGNLNIESVQDTLEQRLHSTDTSVTAGVTINAAGKVSGNGSVGATYGHIYEDKAWVKKQAGISGGNVKIDVKGNTNLKGAKIEAEDGNLDFSTGSLTYEDLKDKHVRDGGYGGFGASFSKKGLDSVDIKGGRVEGFDKAQTVKATIGAGNIKVGGKKLEETGSGINRDTANSIVSTKNDKHFKFDFDYTISPNDFKSSKKKKTNSLSSRKSDSGSDIKVSRQRDDTTETVSDRVPLDTGSSVPKQENTLKPDIIPETKVNINKKELVPKIDSGIRKINKVSEPVIDSGKTIQKKTVAPIKDPGKVKKENIIVPKVDTGLVLKPDIKGIDKFKGDTIVDKVESTPKLSGEKATPEAKPVVKDVEEKVKYKKENVDIGSADYKKKTLSSDAVQGPGEPAKIKDYTPKEERDSTFKAKQGGSVSLGKELADAIETAIRENNDPYVATNVLLSGTIAGQEAFLRGRKDNLNTKLFENLVGDNYSEIQKKELHKIVTVNGPNGMKALDQKALEKFVSDLDKYDAGLKAAKAAYEAGDVKGTKEILKNIRDFSNIKVDSPAYKKYDKIVKQKDQEKVAKLDASGRNKEFVPTEAEIQEAKANDGVFYRKIVDKTTKKEKLVKYDIKETVKGINYKDEATGSVVNKKDFDSAEYSQELGGKIIKISDTTDSSKVWVLKDGSDKPEIKEIPKYLYEKGTETITDPLTQKVYTKKEIQEAGKIPLNEDGSRYLTLDELGNAKIQKEVSEKIEGTEKLLDPNTGKPLIGTDGKPLTVKDLEGISSTIENYNGNQVKGVKLKLNDGRVVFFREKDEVNKPNSGDVVGVGENNFYRSSGQVNVKDGAGTTENKRDSYLPPAPKSFKDKYKEAAIYSEEKYTVEKFRDPITGREITKNDFKDAQFNKELGGKVISTADPNRKLVLKENGEMESVKLPDVEIIPGTEKFVDPISKKEVRPEDIKNAEVNSLLGKKAIEIGDGRYFTLNDDGTVKLTEVTNIVEMPPKYVDSETKQEISDTDFETKKKYNDVLKTEAVDLGDGRFFVRDSDGDVKVATVKEVQVKDKTTVDSETGREITDKEFNEKAESIDGTDSKVVKISENRYFFKDESGEIKIKEISEVQERDSKVVDTATKTELVEADFDSKAMSYPGIDGKAVKISDNRYFVKDESGEIKILELDEVQERPKTIIDKETGKQITDKEFSEKAKVTEGLDTEAVEISKDRYFIKDKDGNIKILERKESQEKPETIKDPITGLEITNQDFNDKSRYNSDLGKEGVAIGDNRYFVKDTNGQVKIVTVEKTETKIEHIVDPKTKKEITKQDIENAAVDSTLGEKGVKIEDGRYFKLDENGDIVIKEFVSESSDVFYDKETAKKISSEDIKKADIDETIGERAIKVDENTYYVLNDKGEVEKLKTKTVTKENYEVVGKDFNKKLSEAEYQALSYNPELSGKVLDLGDSKLLVLKENGEGYVTTRDVLEKKVAKETVETLIKDAISKGDASRLKEIISQSKDNTKLTDQMRQDLAALDKGGSNEKLSDKEFIKRVESYNKLKDSENTYIDKDTGEIYNLDVKNLKKSKELSEEETQYDIGKNKKLIINKETGEAKIEETKTTLNVWEGRKDWLVYKIGKKIFGKKEETKNTELSPTSSSGEPSTSGSQRLNNRGEEGTSGEGNNDRRNEDTGSLDGSDDGYGSLDSSSGGNSRRNSEDSTPKQNGDDGYSSDSSSQGNEARNDGEGTSRVNEDTAPRTAKMTVEESPLIKMDTPSRISKLKDAFKNIFNIKKEAPSVQLKEIKNYATTENTPEMQAKIEKVAGLETSEKWENIKTATNVRYLQKIAEDKATLDTLREKAAMTGGIMKNIDTAFTRDEEGKLFENLAAKKQEAFDEVVKRQGGEQAKFRLVTAESLNINNKPGEITKGEHSSSKNEFRISEDLPTSEKLRVLDHEIGHQYQANIIKDQSLAKAAGVKKDAEAFKYDLDNYDSSNKEYYEASIMERDTMKNEKVTKIGLDTLDKKVLQTGEEIDRDTQGYIGIDKPSSFVSDSKNPFYIKDSVSASAKNELDFSQGKQEELKKVLSENGRKEFETIMQTYNDLQRFSGEIAENDQKNILNALGSQLNQLKAKNKKLASYIDKNKPQIPKQSEEFDIVDVNDIGFDFGDETVAGAISRRKAEQIDRLKKRVLPEPPKGISAKDLALPPIPKQPRTVIGSPLPKQPKTVIGSPLPKTPSSEKAYDDADTGSISSSLYGDADIGSIYSDADSGYSSAKSDSDYYSDAISQKEDLASSEDYYDTALREIILKNKQAKEQGETEKKDLASSEDYYDLPVRELVLKNKQAKEQGESERKEDLASSEDYYDTALREIILKNKQAKEQGEEEIYNKLREKPKEEGGNIYDSISDIREKIKQESEAEEVYDDGTLYDNGPDLRKLKVGVNPEPLKKKQELSLDYDDLSLEERIQIPKQGTRVTRKTDSESDYEDFGALTSDVEGSSGSLSKDSAGYLKATRKDSLPKDSAGYLKLGEDKGNRKQVVEDAYTTPADVDYASGSIKRQSEDSSGYLAIGEVKPKEEKMTSKIKNQVSSLLNKILPGRKGKTEKVDVQMKEFTDISKIKQEDDENGETNRETASANVVRETKKQEGTPTITSPELITLRTVDTNTERLSQIIKETSPDKSTSELLKKYETIKSGIKGEDGNIYGLNPKKEGKKISEKETELEKAKEKFLANPNTENEKLVKAKSLEFNKLLKANEKKIDLVLVQENLPLTDLFTKKGNPDDKYKGKVVTVDAKEIGLVKPVQKIRGEAIDKEILKKDYTKGLITGKFYQGKPDITDPSLRPENIKNVKDNTVNILVHGTFSATAAENGWTASEGVYAKKIEDQYGGKSVAFKWSGKNTADARKQGGEELAKIIKAYNDKGIKVNVVAHSHGGNVANQALKSTEGKVENLVTLGTPVRDDFKLDRSTIEKKTGYFLNVMSDADAVTRKGGLDTKKNTLDYLVGDNKLAIAHRKDLNADKVVNVKGASHEALHSLAVIKQLKPTKREVEEMENSVPTSLKTVKGSSLPLIPEQMRTVKGSKLPPIPIKRQDSDESGYDDTFDSDTESLYDSAELMESSSLENLGKRTVKGSELPSIPIKRQDSDESGYDDTFNSDTESLYDSAELMERSSFKRLDSSSSEDSALGDYYDLPLKQEIQRRRDIENSEEETYNKLREESTPRRVPEEVGYSKLDLGNQVKAKKEKEEDAYNLLDEDMRPKKVGDSNYDSTAPFKRIYENVNKKTEGTYENSDKKLESVSENIEIEPLFTKRSSFSNDVYGTQVQKKINQESEMKIESLDEGFSEEAGGKKINSADNSNLEAKKNLEGEEVSVAKQDQSEVAVDSITDSQPTPKKTSTAPKILYINDNYKGEKPTSPSEKLEILSKNLDKIPKEHLLKQLGDLGLGISNKEYQKLLEENKKDPSKKIVINEKLELKTAKDRKAIDKIYNHLSKTTSEEYKEVRKNLDQNFLERLVGNEKLKELMKSKLVGDANKIRELYNIVEEAKYNSFKEVTGIEPKRANLILREDGAFAAEQASYDRRGNVVEANTKPFLSFLRSRAKNNEEILNTFIHELTHQEQGVLAENVYSDNIKDIKSEAKLFLINDELYIEHEKGDMKKYKAQPLEKEAFETGDTLAKKYLKKK